MTKRCGHCLFKQTLVLLCLIVGVPVAAHEGHDHGTPAEIPATKRATAHFAAVEVVVPRAAQHGLVMRTVPAPSGVPARTLPAYVAADPGHSARVTAPFPGTLGAPAGGFPRLGQRVKKGQLLGWLRPTLSNAELSELRAELASAERDRIVTKKQIDQYTLMLGTGAASDNTPAYLRMRADHDGALKRKKEYEQGLARRSAVRAPLGGVISSVDMYVGRVVAPGDALMQIVQPGHLWVTALSYDTRLRPPAKAHALTADAQRVELELIGESRRLLGQALPLQYRVVHAPASLALGQTLTLHLQNAAPAPQVLLPAASVFANGDTGRVWIQVGLESFAQRTVRIRRHGDAYEILSGLMPGERVVQTLNPRLRALFSRR